MKKNVWVFGLISGLIITALMVYSVINCYSNPHFKENEVLGYTGMLVAFSFIFVGIKNYRDRYNNGIISFGRAFKMGLFISLLASTFYVATWLVEYYVFFPDFMDKYGAHMINRAKADNLSPAAFDKKVAQVNSMKAWYKNPVMVILITYMEVLPVGLVISVISALLLKKKTSAA